MMKVIGQRKNNMQKNIILSILLAFFLFSCASKEATFLYKGDFFKKGISAVNYPYQLTTDVASEFYPAVSPDGKYIIYVSDKTGNLDLWLYNILHRESFRITYHTSDDTMPCFSKNGKKVIFISFRKNGLGDIFKMAFDDILERSKTGLPQYYIKELLKDDGAKLVTMDKKAESEPAYIDNKYLFFVQPDKKGLKNIFKTRDKENTSRIQITFKGAISPAVSPDKKLLAFVDISKNQSHHSHVFILDLFTGKKQQITYGDSIETRPCFIDNNILLYSSSRLDSNKNHSIDLNDNSSLFLYNLKTKNERHLTPDNYTDYYPLYSRIYGGVIIYVSNLLDNIGLWMLPLEGFIPELKITSEQVRFTEALDDDYLKLTGYNNLINRKNINQNRIQLNIANTYTKLNYPEKATSFLSNIIRNASHLTPEVIEAELCLILNSSQDKKEIITRINELKNSIKANASLDTEIHLINYKLSDLYKETKEYEKSISMLEEIASSYTNKDRFFFKSMHNLMNLYLQFNQFAEARENTLSMAHYPDFDKRIGFINDFIDLYVRYSTSVNISQIYKELLNKFKAQDDFYFQTLYKFALSIKNIKEANKVLNQVLQDSNKEYFRIKALEQLYLNTKDEKYIRQVIQKPVSKHSELKEIVERLKNIIIKKHLTRAREDFNQTDFLSARDHFQKALRLNKENIGALTGSLRCDLKLLKPDEKKYNRLIEKYDKVLENDPYNYIYHYLKGYGYSLIYSIYYLKYKSALKYGEPSVFKKFINLFRSNKPYPSYYKKKMKKYFELSEESLKIATHLKPDFIPAYLTSGWIYQVHAGIDKDNFAEYIENAVPLYQSAIHFNDEVEDSEQESYLCLNLANLYYNLQNYSQALQYYNRKIEHNKAFENKLQESFYYYHRGYAAWFLGGDNAAVGSFLKGYTNFMNINEYTGAYRCLVFIAMVHRINDNYEEALNHYDRALSLIEKQNLEINKERMIREIGISYNNLNQPETAMSFFNQAARVMPEEKKSFFMRMRSWWNRPAVRIGALNYTVPVWGVDIALGQSFASMGFKNRDEKKLLYALISDTYIQLLNYKKGLEYLLLKKKLLEEDKNFDAIPYVNNNIGMIYFKFNDFNSARKYFSESIKLLKKDTKKNEQGNKIPKDMYGIVVNNLNLVEVLIKQNQTTPVKDYFKQVTGLLDKSIETCREKKYSALLIKAYNLYGMLYFKKALKNKPLPVKPANAYNNIRVNNQDYLKSLKYYRSAVQLASKRKRKQDVFYINFNIGLIYYYTQDFNSARETFQQVQLNAKKHLMMDLKWKSEYYILKINQLLSKNTGQDDLYVSIIDQIEKYPKGYNYNPLEEPVIEDIYDEYIHDLVMKSNYSQALRYIEKKKNFAIREIFRSYPFELRKQDRIILKNIRDIENQVIIVQRKAQKKLLKKFDIKKRNEFEAELDKLFTKKSNLINSINNKPELVYYIYKNDYSFDEKIKNLPDKNGIMILHLYQNNLSLGIITNSFVTFRNIHINEKKFENYISQLNNNLAKNKDFTSLSQYFNKAFIKEDRKIFKNKEIITIIPDGMFFQFPFHLFLKEKKINYDISLTQFFFNLEKVSISDRKITICNSGSRLNRISVNKNIFPKKSLSIDAFADFFQNSYIMHITDGLKFDAFNPVNYSIVYNKKYDIRINKLLKNRFRGELISFENLADNFVLNEKNIYSLLIPVYYAGVPSATFNLWHVKEKINYPFWNNFYNEKDAKLIDKYSRSLKKLYKANNDVSRSCFKVLYGNFGTDQEYKISILSKELDEIKENIKTETDITNKIFNINNLLQIMDELNSLKTNFYFNKKTIYTNLIGLYMKSHDFRGALENLNVLISIETNRREKEKFQNQYTNILIMSQMTNNDTDKLSSFIEAGDTFYTNGDFDEAVEQYKRALDYLKNSTIKGYKSLIIYNLSLSLIADDLKKAKIWIQKGMELPEEERAEEFEDKFSLLSAKAEYLSKNYNRALTLLTNIGKKDKDYYGLKIQSLLKTDMLETTKYSQVNHIITFSITNIPDKALKEIFNPVIEYYKNKNENIYQFLNKYKNRKYHTEFDLSAIQQSLPAGSLFMDFYMSDNYIYSIMINKKTLARHEVKLKKFNSAFEGYHKSIQENNEEEFNDSRNSLFKLLFKDVQKNISNHSNIILFPDETLFFINYYNLNKNIFSISNKHITIIKSYTSLTNKKKQSFSFQAYGVQKNLPGKVITDFSYKEIKELENYFKGSLTEINPLEIRINESINSFHVAMPVMLSAANINLYDANNGKNYDLMEMLENRYLYLMLLTKMNYKEFNSDLINKLNTENLLISLWRNNDALSAIFIRNFYYYLSLYGSIDKAYRMTLQKMTGLYQNHLAWNSFILIQ